VPQPPFNPVLVPAADPLLLLYHEDGSAELRIDFTLYAPKLRARARTNGAGYFTATIRRLPTGILQHGQLVALHQGYSRTEYERTQFYGWIGRLAGARANPHLIREAGVYFADTLMSLLVNDKGFKRYLRHQLQPLMVDLAERIAATLCAWTHPVFAASPTTAHLMRTEGIEPYNKWVREKGQELTEAFDPKTVTVTFPGYES
jgi:hypothetical protein